MEKLKYIYVSMPYTGRVIECQVYDLIEYLHKSSLFSEVVLIQQVATDGKQPIAEDVLKRYSFRYCFCEGNSYYPQMRRKTVNSLKPLLEKEVTSNTVLHVRSGAYADAVRSALPEKYKNTLILDEFRGAVLSELDYVQNNTIASFVKTKVKKWYMQYCYNRLWKGDNYLFTGVSPKLKELMIANGARPELVTVHPNIAASIFRFHNETRLKTRKELGIPQDAKVAVCSSGEGGKWQKDADIIDRLLNLGFVVMNMGKTKIGKSNVINLYVNHDDMPAYLSAADVAVLWRDKVLLNEVASPSKFSEFALMGLFMIHNNSVSLASSFIRDNNAGILVDTPDQISISEDMLTLEARELRCRAGYELFSIEGIADSYYKLLTNHIGIIDRTH